MCGGLFGSLPYHPLLHRKISPRFLPTKAQPTVRLGWTPSSKTTGLKATLLDDWQKLKPSFGTPPTFRSRVGDYFFLFFNNSITEKIVFLIFFLLVLSKTCFIYLFIYLFLLKRGKSLHRRVKPLTITVTLPHYLNVFTRQCTKPLRF